MAWEAAMAGKDSLKEMPATHLSREAHKRLTEELEQLTTEGRVRIARAIELARNMGDLSENADYHAAKDEQGRMEGRIRQLEAMLKDVVLVEDRLEPGGAVSAGSIVSIRYEGDDDVERYLVGSIEERPEGVEVISPGSPLGQALIGHSVGETVEFQAPSGALKVEIVSVGE